MMLEEEELLEKEKRIKVGEIRERTKFPELIIAYIEDDDDFKSQSKFKN